MRDENNLSWGTIIIYGLFLAAVLGASFGKSKNLGE